MISRVGLDISGYEKEWGEIRVHVSSRVNGWRTGLRVRRIEG